MIIGERKIFAVEFELDDNSGGLWMFGKFCYWIGGEMVGDFDNGASLRDIYLQMGPILKIKNRNINIFDFSPFEIHALIKSSVYGDNCILDNALDYVIAPPVDVFDEFKIFAFSMGDEKCIVTYQREGCDIKFISLPCSEFHGVMSNSYREIERIYDRENG
ncbi:Imm42 family immunity protein [Xanthomonas oryzae]|uniref:Imm42 family immunity protein n=1 Tax=Xanthomonas oryzae TaxID=347 RepID=UPI000949D4EC|nr:Imm42 family immunity protein [Xanthomonas oryzae]